jgi:hypothetical protein
MHFKFGKILLLQKVGVAEVVDSQDLVEPIFHLQLATSSIFRHN